MERSSSNPGSNSNTATDIATSVTKEASRSPSVAPAPSQPLADPQQQLVNTWPSWPQAGLRRWEEMKGSFIYFYTQCFPGIKLLWSPIFKLSEEIVIIKLYQISCCFAIKIKCNDRVKYILNINRKGMKWSFISISTHWFVESTLERPLPCCFLIWMRINIFDCHLVFFICPWTIKPSPNPKNKKFNSRTRIQKFIGF